MKAAVPNSECYSAIHWGARHTEISAGEEKLNKLDENKIHDLSMRSMGRTGKNSTQGGAFAHHDCRQQEERTDPNEILTQPVAQRDGNILTLGGEKNVCLRDEG